MSALRPGGKLEFETPCTSCLERPYYLKADHAAAFGHVFTEDGLRAFIRDGVCELCSDIATDFAFMHVRKDGGA